MATKQSSTVEKDELSASKEAAMEAYEKLLEARQHFTKAAGAAGMDLKDEAFEQLAAGRDKIEALGGQAKHYIEEKPLASLGIAFLFGFILSLIFSRK